MGVWHAVGHPVPFFNGVDQPEIDGVDAQFFGQLVDDRLNGERTLGLAGSPISLDLLFVADHVIAVDQKVLDVVSPGGAQGPSPHRGTGVGAGLEGHPQLGGGDLAVLGCADLRAHS